MTAKYEKIEVVNTSDEKWFVKNINTYLKEGWEILSTHIGYGNSDAYNFCGCYMAIIAKRESEILCTHEISDSNYKCGACSDSIEFPDTF